MNRQLFLLVVPALALAAPTQADFYSHRYTGVSYSDLDIQGFCEAGNQFVQGLNNPERAATTGGCSQGGSGWKIYGGWRWKPEVAVELSYQQLSDNQLDFRLDFPTGEYLEIGDEIETQLINAFAVGHWPIGGGFSLFAKAGGGFWASKLSESQSGELLFIFENEEGEIEEELIAVSGRVEERDTGFHWGYGAGISYRYQNNWTIRAEWESFSDVGSEDFRGGFDVETASLGWSMHF
ncbi:MULTISPECIES: outer membrane beta-barrel protein [unclassified Microbulbifer]|uniref:outer membrane beta-barrel protein n=1 Tax=unclassified Microbulbifer TaxID=2619833 RepID=UPI0027E5A219|nr:MULTISPECIES: outer membrane beta-barrel protein [unclassified Microbulbifer]